MNRYLLKGALSLAAVVAAAGAASAATVKGSLTDEGGKPLSGVKVSVPALQKGAVTAADGSFSVDGVPNGNYVLQFRKTDYAAEIRKVSVTDAVAPVAVTMHQTPIEIAPITITAAPQPSSTLTTPASVSVIEGRALDKARGQSVMSSIQDEPGVNMSGEGPTVIKPVLRGLNAQEVVIVEDGVRSEALQWGNEHAPEIDAMGADRIEVMRGPNSLLYGSDALAGVISISHPELPNAKMGDGALSGKLAADFDSVNNSVGQGAVLRGAQGDWGWRTTLSQRQAGNYRNPSAGAVPNTGEQEINGDGSIGVRKDWGSLAIDYGRFTKRVELQNVDAPGFPDVPLNDMEYQVLIHDKGSVKANVLTNLARLELTVGYDRANRSEYDQPQAPDNPATLHWIQTNYSVDVKAHHEPIGPLQGTVGFSGLHRIEQSIGVSHLTPGYNQTSAGEYIYEELPLGNLNLSAGIRADQIHYNIGQDDQIGADTTPTPVAKQSLNYNAFSGALGGVYHITEPLAFAVNAGRGYRNPVVFELFAFGEHEGEHVFSIGNPNLQPETSLNTDASLRWASQRVKAEVGVFRNYIHNYIYGTYVNTPDPSGQGLPVVQTAQTNATIQGVDFAGTVGATDWLTLKGNGNLVRGYNDNYADATLPNHNIPHVPADNLKIGAEVHQKRLGDLYNPYFGLDAKGTRAQRRTGPEDIGTPGYVLVGLRTGTELSVMNNRLSMDAGVDNLLNKGYIDYNSLVKFANIQNPGRNIYMRVSVPFGS